MLNNYTTLGRTLLYYRADLWTYLRPLLSSFGLFSFALIALPRLLILFSEDYSSWAEGYAYRYSEFGVLFYFLCMSMSSVWGDWYIHNRTHSLTPMPFSLVPARLREKVIGMILILLSVRIVSILSLSLVYAFDLLSLPIYLPTLSDIYNDLSYEGISLLLSNSLPWLLFSLSVTLSSWLCMMRVRQFVLALCLSWAIVSGLMITYGLLIGHYISEHIVSERGSFFELYSNATFWVTTCFWGFFTLLFLWLCYRAISRLSN